MSKFESLNGRLDALGILALAAQNAEPSDHIYVMVLKKDRRPTIFRSNMGGSEMALCCLSVQHDAFSEFHVIQYEPGDFNGAS